MKTKIIHPTHEGVVSFNENGKPKTFKIYHNLPDVHGMSFNNAVDSWLHRTDVFTPESLCKYIMDKSDKFGLEQVCMTEKEFKKYRSKLI